MKSKEEIKKWLKDNGIERTDEQIEKMRQEHEKMRQEHEKFSKASFHIILDKNGHFMGVRDQTTKPSKESFINKDAKDFIQWVKNQAYVAKDFSANVEYWSNGKLLIVYTDQSFIEWYDQQRRTLNDYLNEAEEIKKVKVDGSNE